MIATETKSPLILANTILEWLVKDPTRDVLTFVVVGKNGEFVSETRTYQQLWDNGQRLAMGLQAKGMQPGDSFAVAMQNHPEFVELMVASSILGTIFVPVDPRTRGDKLKYMLDFTGCKGAVVAHYALEEVTAQWQDRDDVWILSLDAENTTQNRLESLLENDLPQPPLTVQSTDPDAPMQMLFTSGTTGDPKAIQSTHRRFGETARIAKLLGLTEEDRPYSGLSMTHANAQLITLGNCLTLGMRGVISRKFTKSRLWDITREFGCTFFNLLGGMTTAIFADPVKDNDADNPVKRILSAGMPVAIWEDFSKRYDVEIYEFYGAAEGGMTLHPPGQGPKGSCGRCVPTLEMKLFDDDGNEVAVGQAGEICFRNKDASSPVVQYFKNPEASVKKTRGGWLRMGDIGRVDEDGWLFFHYRKGGGIRKNGDFINTAFIEKNLAKLTEVSDVFVYGIDSDTLATGEKEVVAAIVLRDDVELDVSKIFDDCKKNLDNNSNPDYLQVVDEIPKTASEKPQERFLIDMFNNHSERIFSKSDCQ